MDNSRGNSGPFRRPNSRNRVTGRETGLAIVYPPTDTRPEAEAVLLALLRQAPPWRKSWMVEQLNQQMRSLSLAGVRARHPHADKDEVWQRPAELWLGQDLAAQLEDVLALGETSGDLNNAMNSEVAAVTLQVISVLEELQIVYVIGGSLASTYHGVARTTLDADIVADIHVEHLPTFVARLQGDFYIAVDALADAIIHHSSFNLIHLRTLFKATGG